MLFSIEAGSQMCSLAAAQGCGTIDIDYLLHIASNVPSKVAIALLHSF